MLSQSESHQNITNSFSVKQHLNKELDALKMLDECVGSHKRVCNNSFNILNNLDTQICTLLESVKHINERTSLLSNRLEKSEQLLSLLTEAIEYENVATSKGQVVMAGPSNNLMQYIETLRNVAKALEFLDSRAARSSSIPMLNKLRDTGTALLIEHHKELCMKNVSSSILFSTNTFTEWVFTQDKILGDFKHDRTFCYVPFNVQHDLKMIDEYLYSVNHGDLQYLNIYCNLRIGLIKQSISKARINKDKIQSEVKGEEKESVAPNNETDASGKAKNPKKTKFPDIKKISGPVSNLKANSLKHRRSISDTGSQESAKKIPEEAPQKEPFDYSFTFAAIMYQLMIEFTISKYIFNNDCCKICCVKLFHNAFNTCSQELKSWDEATKKSIKYNDYTTIVTALSSVVDLLKFLYRFKPLIHEFLSYSQFELQKKAAKFYEDAHALVKEYFDTSVSEFTKKYISMQIVPVDCSVHEMTANIMLLIEKLLSFKSIYSQLYMEQNQGNQSPDCKTTQDSSSIPEMTFDINYSDGSENAAKFHEKVLGELLYSLISLMNLYEKQICRHIFLLNNYSYVENSIEDLKLRGFNFKPSKISNFEFKSRVTQTLKDYISCWMELLDYFQDSPQGFQDHQNYICAELYLNKSLKREDKVKIKNVFKEFNERIEIFLNDHLPLTISNSEVRRNVIEELESMFLKKYHYIYHKFNEISFTSNRGKYIPYTPGFLETKIRQLFSGSFSLSSSSCNTSSHTFDSSPQSISSVSPKVAEVDDKNRIKKISKFFKH